KDNVLIIKAKNACKKEKTVMGTFRAHIKNMIKGVNEGHIYKLKICSGHFPMNVAMSGKDFSVSNFLGEKTPRKMIIKEGAKIKIEGEHIIVESTNKEIAGQTAANIETLTKIKGRDKRIFQDGIYIIEKDGNQLG
ncbi:MAG: 50S ribosomal protein L6, partial [Nanoarchaeota archaeon]|nr:50S ribosomal protein L6 [Nanoarchaeota archaeon]